MTAYSEEVAEEEMAMRRSAPTEDAACTTGCVRPPEQPELKPLYAGAVQMPPPFEWTSAMAEFRKGRGAFKHDSTYSRDHERRADLEAIEWLLEYRRVLVQRLAPLATMHKHDGKWDETRRAIRGIIAGEIRRAPNKFGFDKVPGAEALTDAACADPRYIDALRKARAEDTEYEQLKDELERLSIRIDARKVANLQYNREVSLQ